MRPVIPFVSESEGVEREAWISALPEGLQDIGVVKPFADLTEDERRAAKVAIVANPSPAEVARLPNLEWVHSLWAGVERLASELPPDGPKIVRLTDPQMAATMSEAVLAWTLYLHRDMPRYARQQPRKIWLEHALKTPDQRTVGILGLGKLGSASALRLKANGFNVCGWSRSPKQLDGVETFSGASGLSDLLARSDILVLLVPLTDATRGLVSREEVARLPKGASLINFARGPILDTAALVEALDSGRLDHAVLDVFNTEPLPADSPLWSHEKITVLPHISAPTITHTAVKIVAHNIRRYLETGEIPESVDRIRGY
jgi:glyoxylate/hydroxypyruvate reductase A